MSQQILEQNLKFSQTYLNNDSLQQKLTNIFDTEEFEFSLSQSLNNRFYSCTLVLKEFS